MKLIKKILFINVVVILLLHTFVPHQHHNEMTFEEHNIVHNNVDGIFELIGLAFHEGSIDNFDIVTIYEDAFQEEASYLELNSFANLSFTTIPIISSDYSLFSEFASLKLPSTIYRQSCGVRGPPA